MNAPILSTTEFEHFADYFRQRCGLNLSADKEYLVRQRLGPLLHRCSIPRWSELLVRLRQGLDEDLVNEAIHAITTHETYFFRDGHPFASFASRILPELAAVISERRARPFSRRGPQARIWTAAVSTGQEVYSLAMLIDRFAAGPQARGFAVSDIGILATDISHAALAQAMAGEYNEVEIRRGLDDQLRDRYFQQVGRQWRVRDQLRSGIQFQVCSLIEDFRALGAFDVILCRNVMIYFADAQRRAILDRFADMLDPGGLLMLGASEHILPQHPAFASERIDGSTWYRRVAVG